MKSVNLAIVALVMLFAAGCATTTEQLPVIAPAENAFDSVPKTINIDKRLLEECPSLTDLPAAVRPSDVLVKHSEDARTIKCLQEKNKGLVNIVKKAFNLD